MKILIIGNGFIASEVINTLESEGHQILIFSRSSSDSARSNHITGDLFNIDSLGKALKWKPQVIIHTAWVTAQRLYTNAASNFDYAFYTSELARTILNTNVEHFIVLGSCAEYGPLTGVSVAGQTELNPVSIYGQQKVAAFNSVSKILHNSGTRLSWLRIFQPYGPNQDNNRLIPYMVNSIKNSQQIDLFEPSTVRDWITTRDIASAVSFVIKNSLPIELDIGTTIGYTNMEVLRTLENLISTSNQWERFLHQPDNEKLFALVGKESPLFKFGWRPGDDLEDGLKWTLSL